MTCGVSSFDVDLPRRARIREEKGEAQLSSTCRAIIIGREETCGPPATFRAKTSYFIYELSVSAKQILFLMWAKIIVLSIAVHYSHVGMEM